MPTSKSENHDILAAIRRTNALKPKEQIALLDTLRKAHMPFLDALAQPKLRDYCFLPQGPRATTGHKVFESYTEVETVNGNVTLDTRLIARWNRHFHKHGGVIENGIAGTASHERYELGASVFYGLTRRGKWLIGRVDYKTKVWPEINFRLLPQKVTLYTTTSAAKLLELCPMSFFEAVTNLFEGSIDQLMEHRQRLCAEAAIHKLELTTLIEQIGKLPPA